MLTNFADITIFNARKCGRETVYFKHQVSGVNFHGTDQLLVNDKAVSTSDTFVIRIPDVILRDFHFVDKTTYKSLPLEELQNCFTVQKGDYVVKGLVDEDYSSSADIVKNCEAMQITQITENLHGSAYARHIKLVVK